MAELSVEDLSELTEAWAVSLRASGKTRETVRVYLRNVGQFLTYCDEHAVAEPIRRRSLEAFLADLLDRGREGMTARGRLTACKMFARWLVAVDELETDPFVDVRPPAVDTKVVQPLADEQVRAMLDDCKTTKTTTPERAYLNARDEAILRLMFETGLRAGEVVGLLKDDVRWTDDPPFLTVTKAKSRRGRNVPFSPQAAQAVGAYLRARRRRSHAAAPEMWLGARGAALTYAGLYDALVARAERAGVVGFHPHRMRHTAAHRWLAAGGSEVGLMTMAGWSRGDMLQRYTRGRAEQRAADEARRLNLGEL
jgi:site-specific recombinase XerD